MDIQCTMLYTRLHLSTEIPKCTTRCKIQKGCLGYLARHTSKPTSVWQQKDAKHCLFRNYKFLESAIYMIFHVVLFALFTTALFLVDSIVQGDQSGLNTTFLKWQTWQHWGILFGLKRLMPYFPFIFDRRVIRSIKHSLS